MKIGDTVHIPIAVATTMPYRVIEVHEGSHIVVLSQDNQSQLIGVPTPSWDDPETWCYARTFAEAQKAAKNFLGKKPL